MNKEKESDNPTITLWKHALKELDAGNLNKAFSIILKSGN